MQSDVHLSYMSEHFKYTPSQPQVILTQQHKTH